MPKCRLIEYMKDYVYQCYVGDGEGPIGELLDKYWTWRLDRMSEGEIMKRYYEITNKPIEYRTEENNYE